MPSLTEDQLDAGLTLTDEEHFLALRLDGRIISVFGRNTTKWEIRHEADKLFNHKSLWCSYSRIACQEGWCTNCNLFPKV